MVAEKRFMIFGWLSELPIAIDGDVLVSFGGLTAESPEHFLIADGLQHFFGFLSGHRAVGVGIGLCGCFFLVWRSRFLLLGT